MVASRGTRATVAPAVRLVQCFNNRKEEGVFVGAVWRRDSKREASAYTTLHSRQESGQARFRALRTLHLHSDVAAVCAIATAASVARIAARAAWPAIASTPMLGRVASLLACVTLGAVAAVATSASTAAVRMHRDVPDYVAKGGRFGLSSLLA